MRKIYFLFLTATLAAALSSLNQDNKAGPLPELKQGKPEQIELGRLLFFDARLSGDATISCATCHDPNYGWGDGKPLSTGYPGSEHFRNAKSLLNAGSAKRFYWDGRLDGKDMPTLVRDHLSESHLMNADGRLLIERLKQVPEYVEFFKKRFGGEPSYGKILDAVSAFVRSIESKNVPFDRFIKGEENAISESGRRGYALFTGKAGCTSCHSGPMFTDGQYHRTNVPDNQKIFKEPLRHITFRRFFKTIGVDNFENLRTDVGLYAISKEDDDRGKFLTPTLREISRTAPYMHNGMFASLEEVINFYDMAAGDDANKKSEIRPLGLSQQEKVDLLEFLKTLSGDPVVVSPPVIPEYLLRPLGQD